MTEPVPGIRPTPNQMEGRARRKKTKKTREGTLGITRQAGGAGCLSDNDVEMKSDVSNQGESSDGSKI